MQGKRLLAVFLALIAGYVGIAFFAGRENHTALIRDALGRFASADTITGELRAETIGVFPIGEVSDGELRIPLAAAGPVGMTFSGSGAPLGTADLTAGLSDEAFVNADVRMQWRATADGASFVRFENLPDFTYGGTDLRLFNDQWLRVTEPAATEEDLFPDVRRGTDIGSVALSFFGPLRDMLASRRLVRSADQMVSEMIDGRPTRHYLLQLDRGDVERLLMDTEQVAFGRALTEPEVVNIQGLWDLNDIRVELWIDKDLRELKRIGVDMRPHLDNPAAVPVRFILDISAYGAPVTVEAPEGAITTAELLGGDEGSAEGTSAP